MLERERERAPTFLYYLRRSVGRNLLGQKRKFIYSTKATRRYQKHGISPSIQARSSGNQGFRVREASYQCYYTPRGRDSSYFCLFSTLRVVWLCFMP